MSKTLGKEIGILGVEKVGQNLSLLPGNGEGWESAVPADPRNNVFVNRQYFDLAGLSMDDKTLFFEGATVQETLPPGSSPAILGNSMIIVDVMSNHQITNTQALVIITNGNIASPSTIGGSGLTFDQTVYMRHRVFNTDIDNQAGGLMIPLSDNQLGSMEPTASDRVYVTRIVAIGGGESLYTLYPCRYVLRAKAKEEPEYEYLMRLKRSYELQQEPDRD